MRQNRSVWAPFGVFLILSSLVFSLSTASGQQSSAQGWQGVSPPSLQSPMQQNVSQPSAGQQSSVSAPQVSPPATPDQIAPANSHQTFIPGSQGMYEPQGQREIPTVWQFKAQRSQPAIPAQPFQPAQPLQPAIHTPGYLGVRSRDFHRSRLCMHALSVHGVEITQIEPNSPAERAGLHSAHQLGTRESVVAAVAGLLTLSPAASLAPAAVQAGGGVGHGDIILAVGGTRVKTKMAFAQQLARFGSGTIVYLTVRRGEAVTQIPVQLAEQPTASQASLPPGVSTAVN